LTKPVTPCSLAIPWLAVFTLALVLGASQFASAQTFQVLHNFSGGGDGGTPPYTLTQDSGGRFYGTAATGGQNNDGLVRV
jgi:hypothetical protein